MAYPPFWQPDANPPRRQLSDWRGFLGFSIGGAVALLVVFLLAVIVVFLVMVFTADPNGHAHLPRDMFQSGDR